VFDDLIVELDPPPHRQGKCTGSKERHLTEAAVMLAYAMHLLRTVPDLTTVEIHPDGEHGKRFDIARWLSARGFALKEGHGVTAYCGTYTREQQMIMVTSVPGKGDVVAKTERVAIVAECKGGIVNTRHAGQTSRLRKGLCEAVGLLMASPRSGRQVAVVPQTEGTLRLAQKLAPRAKDAGIEIALVDDTGHVGDVVA
jgi:hypothetical protein